MWEFLTSHTPMGLHGLFTGQALPMRATLLANLILIDSTIIIILDEEYK
jgi:hypothetical protein